MYSIILILNLNLTLNPSAGLRRELSLTLGDRPNLKPQTRNPKQKIINNK